VELPGLVRAPAWSAGLARCPPAPPIEQWEYVALQASSKGFLREWAGDHWLLVHGRFREGRLVVDLGGRVVPVALVVAATFLGPPPFAGARVRHLNAKLDNRAANLAWPPQSEAAPGAE
jgi:hypothetical protein